MNIPEPYAGRLNALRKEMKANNLSAMLVMRPENRRYLSGYTASDPQLDESSGCLFITLRRQYLLTDFRYEIQAGQEAKGWDIVIYTTGQASAVGRLAKKGKVDRLAFEDDFLTVKLHGYLKEENKDLEMVPSPELVRNLRAVKDESEIRLMTKALRITEKAFARTMEFLKPGLTELEIVRYLQDRFAEYGSEGPAFDSIVASGPNAALPHAVPSKRKIKEGETIIFDIGAKYQGYGADMSRTVVLGKPSPWIVKIYNLVREAQLAAIKGMKPGLLTSDADALARCVIEEGGYGPNFGHSLGHGVGLVTHEAPSLSRFRPVELEPGMIVTVEPGIYLEGRGGVRLEEMVLITDAGVKVLNRDKTFYLWPKA